jgi:hypothetical protein
MTTFNLPDDIKTAGEAQSLAIDWQTWVSEQSLSYGELIDYREYFSELGEQFGLLAEFTENNII